MRITPQKRHFLQSFGASLSMLLPMSAAAETIFDQRITVEIGVIPLMIGIGILIAALVIEWNGIINLLKVEHQSLSSIEAKHPHLPKKREVIIVILLSLALTIFLTQIVLQVYSPPANILQDIPVSLQH